MNKRGLLYCILFAAISVTLIMVDNQEYGVQESYYDDHGEEMISDEYETQSLADHFDQPVGALIIGLAFFFPFLLSIESTFFPNIRTGWWRLIFLGQAALFLYLTFLVWLLMVFKFFTEIHVFISYYLILIYLGMGVAWNLILALPYTDRATFVQKSFEILSFKSEKRR
ncbi:MAG: hypothetical protein HYZ14_13820 [Bacteroidetes bacterium]|nr:hypothetical protein [Bacteroidota bacterium]